MMTHTLLEIIIHYALSPSVEKLWRRAALAAAECEPNPSRISFLCRFRNGSHIRDVRPCPSSNIMGTRSHQQKQINSKVEDAMRRRPLKGNHEQP